MQTLPNREALVNIRDDAELAYRQLIRLGWSSSVAAAIAADPGARRRFFAERKDLGWLCSGPTLKRRRRRRGVRS